MEENIWLMMLKREGFLGNSTNVKQQRAPACSVI